MVLSKAGRDDLAKILLQISMKLPDHSANSCPNIVLYCYCSNYIGGHHRSAPEEVGHASGT